MLIRHSKAEKEMPAYDFDRPLKYTGIQDARFMAERIREQSLIPQLIITSPALRTKTTADIFAETLKLPDPAFDRSIYEASQQTWLKLINALPNECDFIAIVGHNPGLSYILQYLTGETKEVHTSTVALVEFDLDSWDAIIGNAGKLAYYSSPNE